MNASPTSDSKMRRVVLLVAVAMTAVAAGLAVFGSSSEATVALKASVVEEAPVVDAGVVVEAVAVEAVPVEMAPVVVEPFVPVLHVDGVASTVPS